MYVLSTCYVLPTYRSPPKTDEILWGLKLSVFYTGTLRRIVELWSLLFYIKNPQIPSIIPVYTRVPNLINEISLLYGTDKIRNSDGIFNFSTSS